MRYEKLSIIIPCYNNEDHLEKAVLSALAQTYNPKEVILVDDGSNYQTKTVINNLQSKIDLVITQENKGVSNARNTGIKASSGNYILVLDADDYFEPSFAQKAIKVFKEKENTKLVTCYAKWFRNSKDFQIYKPIGGDLRNFLLEASAIGNSLFLKCDWEKIGGYDEAMQKGWEDWEFFIRLHALGGETYVIPEVLFNYRKQENSRTSIANERKFELMEYIYLKHVELYKENFDLIIPHLVYKIRKEHDKSLKLEKKIDFRLGQAILKPFRYLKSLIK